MKENKEQRQVNINTALDHRLKGLSYREIADEMGMDRSTVYRYVHAAIKRIQKKYTEKANTLVTMERQKLDKLEVCLLKATRDGDIKAATVMLKIMERRAKLLGLDEPSKSEVKLDAVEVSIKKPEGI